jgi:hypothetical protein
MSTFPWSYGYNIAPTEMKSSLLLNDTIGLILRPLDLRRQPTYAITQK